MTLAVLRKVTVPLLSKKNSYIHEYEGYQSLNNGKLLTTVPTPSLTGFYQYKRPQICLSRCEKQYFVRHCAVAACAVCVLDTKCVSIKSHIYEYIRNTNWQWRLTLILSAEVTIWSPLQAQEEHKQQRICDLIRMALCNSIIAMI